jgi:hypothetical protein
MLLVKLKILINVYLRTHKPKNSDGRKFRLSTSYKMKLCTTSRFRKNDVELTAIFVHVGKFMFHCLIYKSGNVIIVTNHRSSSC